METPHFDTLLIMGRPGSGKGTQSKVLADERGWTWLSSGERFKAIRDSETPLGLRVRTAYDAGQLMPDWFADYLLESSVLELSAGQALVLDGFGRTETQAKHLIDILTWLGRTLIVLNLEVSEEEAMRRMIERAKVEDRPDSNAIEKIKERFATFTNETAPALAVFRAAGLVTDIDGERAPGEVSAAIRTILA